MNVEKIEYRPFGFSLFPAIRFAIRLSRVPYLEALISISGWLKTDDGKFISKLEEIRLNNNRSMDLGGSNSNLDKEFNNKHYYDFELIAPLDKRAVCV
ncbi:MAG: hypothetical protein NTV25_03210 [Methanothrix sp.]|nr:hypothetical protein [Methanothrix sp.]